MRENENEVGKWQSDLSKSAMEKKGGQKINAEKRKIRKRAKQDRLTAD